MNKREFLKLAALASGMSSVAPTAMALDFGKMMSAGTDLVKSANISDAELNAYFDQMTVQYDQQNKIADEKSVYGKRLQNLVKGLESEDGLKLSFKVYETPEVNAFAMANGTIRVYSGLMDLMTDEEIRYVIGHEIGHVVQRHLARMMAQVRAATGQQQLQAVGPLDQRQQDGGGLEPCHRQPMGRGGALQQEAGQQFGAVHLGYVSQLFSWICP